MLVSHPTEGASLRPEPSGGGRDWRCFLSEAACTFWKYEIRQPHNHCWIIQFYLWKWFETTQTSRSHLFRATILETVEFFLQKHLNKKVQRSACEYSNRIVSTEFGPGIHSSVTGTGFSTEPKIFCGVLPLKSVRVLENINHVLFGAIPALEICGGWKLCQLT